MAKSQKPRVIINCVANQYASPGERIIEFSFPDGTGGLISFYSGNKTVSVYRVDDSVDVSVHPERK